MRIPAFTFSARACAAALLVILSPALPVYAQAIFTTAPPSLSRVIPNGSSGGTGDASRERTAITPVAQQAAPQAAPAMPQVPASSAQPAMSAESVAPSAPVMPRAPQPVMPASAMTPSGSLAVSVTEESTFALRHLTNNIQGYRLAGEIGSSEWPVFLTETQTRQKLRFQLGYLSAVSVMPEASFLTLTINDVVVGRANIRATNSVRTLSYDIPPNLLQPGFNSIRLTAEQRHRVDCSLQATNELWTQIDPSRTGLMLQRRDSGVTALSQLAALSPDARGSLPIRAVVPGRTSLANVERIIRATQIISLVGRFDQPVVDLGAMTDGEYGMNLVIGTQAELSGVAGLAGIGTISTPTVGILPANASRRTTIVITGATDAQVSEALGQMNLSLEAKGTPAGLRAAAAFPGYRMEGGQRVSLRDLGVPSEEFSGRLFRAAFNVIMPPDFFSADYAKATLDLAGGYASGLTSEAQIVVSVNGRNATSLKLSKGAGDVFTKSPVPLPLGAMRPGLNRVEIEAQVPRSSDVACDPLAAISGSNRFLFLDSTQIELPRIARIARMPDLAVTATGGFPYAGAAVRPKLLVPTPDRETIGAAATVAAHMAVAAGQPIDFELTGTTPQRGSGSVLVIGAASGIDRNLLKMAGIDVAKLDQIWADRVDPAVRAPRDEALSRYEAQARDRLILERNFPASCRMSKPVGGFERAAAVRRSDALPVASLPPAPVTGQLFEQWNSKLKGENRATAAASRVYEDMQAWFSSKWSGTAGLITRTFDRAPPISPLTRRASLIVAQATLGESSNDVWTMITAPTSAALSESVDCLVDPRVWRQVSGRLSVLDASEGTVMAVAADDAHLIVTQPLTIENTRLIAAGWLSLNSHIYVALALAMAALLAIATTFFVQSVGRKNGG